ncbi:hypothetical protein H0H92_009176 [Tricholoma furcatifolium]|nr:hypothetical protein H0H92_009176 [Tricholoma furcatifolium]
MTTTEAIMMVTMPSARISKVKYTSPPLSPALSIPSKASDSPPLLQNLQFYLVEAHNLQANEDQSIGPAIGTDRITFQVHVLSPLGIKRISKAIAVSASYSIDNLIALQAEQGDKSVSIPLSVDNKHQDAYIVLHVKQPTSAFISEQEKQLSMERANLRRSIEKEKEKEKEPASPPPHPSPTPWLSP